MNLSCRAKNNKSQIKYLVMGRCLQSMLKSVVIFVSYLLLWCNGSVVASTVFANPTHLENHRGTRFYDTSAWNVPMLFGLQAYWAQSVAEAQATADMEPSTTTVDFSRKSDYGYLIDFSSSNIYPALVQLFDRQCHPRIGTKPFQFAGKSCSRGTVLLRGHENPDQLNEILKKIADKVTVHSF